MQPQLFNFNGQQVRTVTIDEEPYFVGRDLTNILQYSNGPKAIRDHVDDEDKTVNDSFTVNGTAPVLINESGLYSLIFWQLRRGDHHDGQLMENHHSDL